MLTDIMVAMAVIVLKTTIFKNSNQTKTALILLAILILIYLIYISVNRGVADIYSLQARALMEDWSASQQILIKDEWGIAQTSVNNALRFSPKNPEYLALMGNLYEWRVVGSEINSTQSVADYKKALNYYEQALHIRPAYAFAWANVAVVKSRLGEVDKQFYLAVDRALFLGKWEPGVQLKIADAMLSVWFLLDKNAWKKMLVNIENGLKSNSAQIMQIAKQSNVLNKLCGKLHRSPEMLRYCK